MTLAIVLGCFPFDYEPYRPQSDYLNLSIPPSPPPPLPPLEEGEGRVRVKSQHFWIGPPLRSFLVPYRCLTI